MTLDPKAMARLLEITGDDIAFVDELVETFFVDASEQLEGLRLASAIGDTAAIIRPAHSLKSNGENVGAVVLAALCRSLEADGRGGDVPDLPGRVIAVEAEFAAVRTALLANRAAR